MREAGLMLGNEKYGSKENADFNVGDRVILTRDTSILPKGSEGTITSVSTMAVVCKWEDGKTASTQKVNIEKI